MKINFSPPYIDPEVISSVNESLNSGWITSGPKVRDLEIAMAELIHVKKVVCINSWTSGAILTLKWYGVGEGDEVIIPAYTYAATALAVMHVGAKPIMVDVGNDFMIDPDQLQKKINQNTKVIMPVDFGGFLANYESINRITIKNKSLFRANNERQKKLGRILVMADSAHSIGATSKGISSGKLCDVSVFSFHAVKNITTAEGGAISLNLPEKFDSEEEYKWLKLMSLNGQTKDAFTKAQAGSWKYDIIMPGLKINMPDICAAIGVAQLKMISKILKERKRVYKRYDEGLSNEDWAISPSYPNTINPSYHLYPLRIKGISEEQRDEIIFQLAQKDISVNVHFNPLPNLTLFKEMDYKIQDYPNSMTLYQNEISLPVYPQLKEDEIDFVLFNLKKIVNSMI